MRSIRIHGKGSHKYDNARVGINGRLDALQAAILLAKLDIFPEEVEMRQKVAQRYTDGLGSHGSLVTPFVPDEMRSVWAQYSILAEDEAHRTQLQEKLKAEGIPTAIYYPTPLHLQSAFENLGHKTGDFPISEGCSQRIFSIPMHPYLSKTDQDRIVDKL